MAKVSQAEIDKGLALFASLGAVIDVDEIKDSATAFEEAAVKERRAAKIGEAEAVLKSLHYPHSLMMKRCNWCGEAFQTNYCAVGSCSDTCRKRYFEETYKIKWNTFKTKTWGDYEPPQVVSAQSVKELHAWATAFIADYDRLMSLSGPEENPMRPREQVVSIGEDGYTTTRYLDQEGSTGRSESLLLSSSGARESVESVEPSVVVQSLPSGEVPTVPRAQLLSDEIEIDLDF